MIHNAYLGEAVHYLKSGHVRRFRPTGEVFYMNYESARVIAASEAPAGSKVEKLGAGGYSARIFIGLNVGTKTEYTLEDIMRATLAYRKKHGKAADGSFLGQKGIYEDRKKRIIEEPSVQIVLIDLSGMSEKRWTFEMTGLAKHLREKFKQETVILEIQNRGLVTALYSVTARK